MKVMVINIHLPNNTLLLPAGVWQKILIADINWFYWPSPPLYLYEVVIGKKTPGKKIPWNTIPTLGKTLAKLGIGM